MQYSTFKIYSHCISQKCYGIILFQVRSSVVLKDFIHTTLIKVSSSALSSKEEISVDLSSSQLCPSPSFLTIINLPAFKVALSKYGSRRTLFSWPQFSCSPLESCWKALQAPRSRIATSSSRSRPLRMQSSRAGINERQKKSFVPQRAMRMRKERICRRLSRKDGVSRWDQDSFLRKIVIEKAFVAK